MKKIGSDTPASATLIEARSTKEPRLSADSTPIVTPNSTQSTAAPTASDSVTGIASRMSGQTGCFFRNEYPRHGAGQCSTPAP